MITDPLFYRLFETSPETFFLLLGMSGEQASDTVARYEYKAVEFKETFLPPLFLLMAKGSSELPTTLDCRTVFDVG
jgi:hypothetical protein